MSDYSDTESVNSTFSESMQTTENFENLELGKDPNAYKKDKNCIICNTKFGKIGIAHARKHFCKFCYRGVCAKCSPQVAFHPTKRTKLRVCNNCCQKSVINKFSESFRIEIDDLREKIIQDSKELEETHQETENITKEANELEENLKEEQEKELKLIQDQRPVFELERNHKIKQEKMEVLLKKSKKDADEIRQKDLALQNYEKELENLKKLKKEKEIEIIKIRDELSEKQDEQIVISRKIEKLMAKIVLTDSEKAQKEKEDSLKLLIHETEIALFQINKEKEENLRIINELTDENSVLTKKIKNSSEDKLVSSNSKNYSPDEEEMYKDLKKRQREYQITIEKLRIELQKSVQKFDDPNDYEFSGSDKTRPCVRCRIF